MSLLDRYVAREILLPFAAGLLFLTQILLATQLLANARLLFGSGVSLLDVAEMMVLLLPRIVSYALPIAFLLGAVIGVGRLAEDREVVALGAAGLSPARLVRVPLALSFVLAAVGLWIAGVLEPLSLAEARRVVVDVVKRNVRNDVRAGTFYDQIPGTTLYAERVQDGRWENVLISDRSDPEAPVLALAREGRFDPVGGGEDMQLTLRGGEMHRSSPEQDEYVVAAFEGAEVVLALGGGVSQGGGLARGHTERFDEMAARADAMRRRGDVGGANRVESSLHRRIAAALAVIPFALLAVPLGAARRAGRAFGVSATVAAVIVHYLLLKSGQVLAQKGALPAAIALQLPTAVLSALGLGLVALQIRRGPGAVR